jgi:uncharacterized protein involved in exopolysaccharide biosynthesis
MAEQKNLLDVLRIWIRWRWLIVGLTVAAAAISVLVALAIPNYYKSTALFYPYNLATQDRAVIFSTASSDRVLNYFGDKYDVNRLLSIVRSPKLMNEVINVYELWDNYGLDTTSARWRDKAQREFRSNFKAVKNELDNIEVSIWDRSEGQAFEMVRYIMKRSGELYGGLIRDRNKNLLERMDEQLALTLPELQKLTDSLATFRDTTSAYYRVLSSQHRTAMHNVNEMRTIRDQLYVTTQHALESIHVISEPEVAERKDRPTRWIIVTATTFAAFFFALLAPVIIEKYRDIRNALRNSPVS